MKDRDTKKHVLFVWILAAASILSLAAASIAFWPQLEARIYLVKLRGEPSLVEEYILASRDTKRAAVTLFLRERAGKEALFDLYLLECQRHVAGSEKAPRENTTSPLGHLWRYRARDLVAGALALHSSGYTLVCYFGERMGKTSASLGLGPKDPARRAAILDRMAACEGEIFRSPLLPGFEFQLAELLPDEPQAPDWSRSRARAQGPSMRPSVWQERPPDLMHLCYFRTVVEDEQKADEDEPPR